MTTVPSAPSIAAKDRWSGRRCFRTRTWWFFHAPAGDDGTAFAGYLFVETRRHAAYLADLTDAEAEAVGRAAARAAAALRAEFQAEFVFSAIVGTGVAHFHQHVFTRHPGTPAGVRWFASDEWPGAPRLDPAGLESLCARLSDRLTTDR